MGKKVQIFTKFPPRNTHTWVKFNFKHFLLFTDKKGLGYCHFSQIPPPKLLESRKRKKQAGDELCQAQSGCIRVESKS